MNVGESLKYLGLEVPSNHRWNECATRQLKVVSDHTMHLRTHAILEILRVGSSRNIFSTLDPDSSLWGGSMGQ